jgi:hypothetical protein
MSRKNSRSSTDIQTNQNFNRTRSRTSSGEQRRSNSIGSRSNSIGSRSNSIGSIDYITMELDGDICDNIDNIYNELTNKSGKLNKPELYPKEYVNKDTNRRIRDVYFDKDGVHQQPSPNISYLSQIVISDIWVKSTRK